MKEIKIESKQGKKNKQIGSIGLPDNAELISIVKVNDRWEIKFYTIDPIASWEKFADEECLSKG